MGARLALRFNYEADGFCKAFLKIKELSKHIDENHRKSLLPDYQGW